MFSSTFDDHSSLALVTTRHPLLFLVPPPPRISPIPSANTQVSPRNRINVAVDWLKVRFFGRDITRL